MYKKRYNIKNILGIFLFINIIISKSFSVDSVKLSTDNANWTSVIGGKAIIAPLQTSYGFVVLTDGKMISACTENGQKLWEKKVPGHPEPFIAVVSNDFLVTVSDNKVVSLINPSGLVLWSKKVGFSIEDNPTKGKDGRFFVRGNKNIACFGINGICKWSISTPQLRNIPLTQFNDGTILAILDKTTTNGKSTGIRITPFGEIIETIDFAGIITDSISCEDGILLSFISGGMGLCKVEKNITQTKWAIPSNDFVFQSSVPSQGAKFIAINKDITALTFCDSSLNTKIIFFENYSGQIKNSFSTKDVFYKNITCISSASNGECLFLSDKTKAFVFNIDGEIVWHATLPDSSSRAGNWNYISYTRNNFIVICSTSWVMNGFRTIQNLSRKKNNNMSVNRNTNNPKRYENFYKIDTSIFDKYVFSDSLDSDLLGKNRIQTLQKGNYGSNEIEFQSKLLSANKAYSAFLASSFSGARQEQKSIFLRDSIGLQTLILQLSYLGTDDVPEILAAMIQTENNTENLINIIKAAGICGYDPNEKMLSSIEKKLLTIPCTNTVLIQNISDCVFQICKFMGRPAFYSHCMEIQKKLLSLQYSNEVHQTVRNNLKKISELKL